MDKKEHDKITEIKDNAVTIDSKNFRITLRKINGEDRLVLICGNFLDSDTVDVEAEVLIPLEKAMRLANNIVSASAYYQITSKKDIGVSKKNCKQMKELMKKAGLL